MTKNKDCASKSFCDSVSPESSTSGPSEQSDSATFEPKPHRKKKSSRKKAPRRYSADTISYTSSISENNKSKSKRSKKSSSNKKIESNRKSFDDKPKSDINSIETEPDPTGYDSESSSSTIFKITRANELSDKEVVHNWRKYVHEFLCNTNGCKKILII